MKFKAGDPVRVTKDDYRAKKGMEGRVAAFAPNGWPGIDLGPGFDGHHLHGAIKTDTGCYVPADHLELLPEEVREIKPGSKWRVASVDVTVKHADDTVLAAFDGHDSQKIEVSREAWYQIATWVSDPVETPKVGSWVRDADGDMFVIVADYCDLPFPEALRDGPMLTPCDPPPLVKALERLEMDGKAYGKYLTASIQDVDREWRALKAKIGVE